MFHRASFPLALAASLLGACSPAESPPAQTAEPTYAEGGDTAEARDTAEPTRPAAEPDGPTAPPATDEADVLSAWVQRLDDDPDRLHLDYTPAVHALSELGRPAALAVLPALEANSADRRLHAQRVVEGVVMREYGWRGGQGFTNGREAECIELLRSIGYAYDAPEAERSTAAARWREWLERPAP